MFQQVSRSLTATWNERDNCGKWFLLLISESNIAGG